MKSKSLITILLVLILFFSGCSHKHNDSPQSSIEGNTDVTTTPITNDNTTSGIDIDKYIWEKEFQTVNLNSIKLNSDWDQYIHVGESLVSAVNMTDISVIPNYFYDKNDSFSDLHTIYFAPTICFSTRTGQVALDKYLSVELDVISTTLEGDVDHNAIVEEVRFISTINPYEGGGIDTLKTRAQYVSDGNFGVGSGYEYVIGLLGEPADSFTTMIDDGINATTCVYVGNNTELVLVFMWVESNGINSAAITSIDWIPSIIRETLHTQPNVQNFEGYKDIFDHHD